MMDSLRADRGHWGRPDLGSDHLFWLLVPLDPILSIPFSWVGVPHEAQRPRTPGRSRPPYAREV